MKGQANTVLVQPALRCPVCGSLEADITRGAAGLASIT